ncbi:MAG: hypothetical protein V3S49_05145 [Thermodesulfobacteriota bacterium]
MIDWQIVSIISVIFNIIFVVLLFFKSALNDILKEWWLDRKKKKEVAIKRLIDFKTKFNLQQTQGLLSVITLALKESSIIMGREVDQFIDDSCQNSLRTSSEARSAISEFIDYLPRDLITHYRRYDEQLVEIIQKIMEGKVSKEDVMEYSNKMTSLVMEITNLADSILREKLD